MTAEQLLAELRSVGAPAASTTVEAVRRACAGGCGTSVGRLATLGLCRVCLDAGAAQKRQDEAAAAEQALLAALPELHRRVTFGSPELATWCRDVDAVDRAQALVANLPSDVRTVLLTGPTNAGKSTLAAAMVRALRVGRRRGAAVQWVDVRALAGGRHLGIDSAPLLRRAIEAGIAVFDDLAKEEHALEYERQALIGALEFRHARLPDLVPDDAVTIITTEREVQCDGARSHDQADLVTCYPLSFVRRIAGAWTDGEVPRGSAVVIPVRRVS